MSKNKKKLIFLYIFIFVLFPTTTYAMQKEDSYSSSKSYKIYTTQNNEDSFSESYKSSTGAINDCSFPEFVEPPADQNNNFPFISMEFTSLDDFDNNDQFFNSSTDDNIEKLYENDNPSISTTKCTELEKTSNKEIIKNNEKIIKNIDKYLNNIKEYIEEKKYIFLNLFTENIKNAKKIYFLDKINFLCNEIYILKTYLEIIKKYKINKEIIKKTYINENFFNSIEEKLDNFFNENINELQIKSIFHYNIIKKTYNKMCDKEKKNPLKVNLNIKKYIKIFEEIDDEINNIKEQKEIYNKNFKELFYKSIEQTILSSINKNLTNFEDEILNLNTPSNYEQNINTFNLLDNETYILKKYLKIIDNYKKYEEYIKEKYKNENFFNSIKEKFDNFFNKNIDELQNKIISHYDTVKKIYNKICEKEKEDLLEVSQNEKEKKHIYNFEEIYKKITNNTFSEKSSDETEQNEAIKMITKNLENIKKTMLDFIIIKTSTNHFIKNIDDNKILENKIEDLEISLNAIEKYKEYKNYIKREYKNKEYFNLIEEIFDVYDKMIEIIKKQYIKNFKKLFYKSMEQIILSSINKNLSNFEDEILNLNTPSNYKKNINTINLLDNEIYILKTYLEIFDRYKKYEEYIKEKYKNKNFFNSIKEKFDNFFNKNINELKNKIIFHYDTAKKIYMKIYYKEKKDILEISQNEKEKYIKNFDEIDDKICKKITNNTFYKKLPDKIEQNETIEMIKKNLENIKKRMLNFIIMKNSISDFIKNVYNNDILNNKIENLKISLDTIEEYEEYKNYIKKEYKDKKYFNLIEKIFNVYDKITKIVKERIIDRYDIVKDIYMKICIEQKENFPKYSQLEHLKQKIKKIIPEYTSEEKYIKIIDDETFEEKIQKIIPKYTSEKKYKKIDYETFEKKIQKIIPEYTSEEEYIKIILESIDKHLKKIKDMVHTNFNSYPYDNLNFLDITMHEMQKVIDVIDIYEKYKKYTKEQYKNEKYFNEIEKKFYEIDEFIKNTLIEKKIIEYYGFTKEIYKKLYDYIEKLKGPHIKIKEFENKLEEIGSKLIKIIPKYDKTFNTDLFKKSTYEKLENLTFKFINRYFIDDINYNIKNIFIPDIKETYVYHNFKRMDRRIDIEDIKPENLLSKELKYIGEILETIAKYKKFKEYTEEQYKNEEYFNQIKEKFDHFDMLLQVPKEKIIYFYELIKKIYEKSYDDVKIIYELKDYDMKEFEDKFLKTGDKLRKIIPEYDKIFDTEFFKEKAHLRLMILTCKFISFSIPRYTSGIVTHVNNYLHKYENQNLNKINTLSLEELVDLKLILESINEYEKYKEYKKKQNEDENYLDKIKKIFNENDNYVKNTKNEYISYYNNIKEIFNLKYKNPKEKLSESEQKFKENMEKKFEEIDKIIQEPKKL